MPRTYKRKGLRVSPGHCGINRNAGALRLYVNHEGKPLYWTNGWRASNPQDVQRCKELQAQIDYDILRGQFDPTFEKYGKKPKGSNNKPEITSILALWEAYKSGNTDVEETTRENYWGMLDKAFTYTTVRVTANSGLKSSNCRMLKVQLGQKYSLSVTKRILQCLRAAWNWSYSSRHII